jgi:hypothetical protein
MIPVKLTGIKECTNTNYLLASYTIDGECAKELI